MRYHLGFPSPSISDLKMHDNAALARLCEEQGFDVLWHSNQRFYREMFIRMASSAIATSRLGLGGAVSEPFAVHPVLTAQSLATVDELSGGRAMLALGAGGSGFQMMGVKRQHSALALREAHSVIKGLLAGQEVTLKGKIVQAHKARLHFLPERLTPLWIATRGDLTLETCGEYADNVMIATYATVKGIRDAMHLVENGAQKSGRTLNEMRIMSRVDTCVHQDQQAAYNGCRPMVANFLWSSYPDRNFVNRLGLEVPPELERLIADRELDLMSQAAELVPDDFVRTFTWSGTPEMVADRVIEIYRGTGIEEYGFWALLAPGQTRYESLRLIANDVLPRIRSAIE